MTVTKELLSLCNPPIIGNLTLTPDHLTLKPGHPILKPGRLTLRPDHLTLKPVPEAIITDVSFVF